MLKTTTILLCLILSGVANADSNLNGLVQRLQQKYENLNSLKANFTQNYQSKRFSDKLVEKGVVHFKKGGLMKWEYLQPEKKIFASDGEHYFYYVVADKQVIKTLSKTGESQQSPTLFLAGRGNFVTDFNAEWADPRQGSHLVKLTPKKEQADFRYLIVDVEPVRHLIRRLLVVDAYENRTEYLFDQIQENPNLPANFFAFQPPPGTDVIFQRGDAGE